MATIEQLRALYNANSDEEAILAASREFNIAPEEIAAEVGFKVGGKWGNRLAASVDNYQANLYGVAEAATGANWARRGRATNEAAANLSTQFARNQGAVDSYKNVGSVGDAADYLGGLAVQSLPYIGEAAVGGIVGRGIGTGLSLGARGLQAAGLIGAGAASYPSAVGDVLSSQRDQAGQTDLGTAAALGVPYAALNAFGIEGAVARGALTRNSVRALDNAAGFRGGVARGTVSAIRTGAEEGVSEVGQEALNQFGRMAVDPNETFLNERSAERLAESFVGGAALGGAFGAAGGWRRGSMGTQPPPPTVDEQPDLLQLGTYQAPPPLTGPQLTPEERAARMSAGFDPGFGEYTPRDGIDYTVPVDTRGLALEPRFDTRPENFDLGVSMPAPQFPEATVAPAVRAPMPGQQELFYPNGQPTYGADQSFSAPEFLDPPSPEFGFADYAPRQEGLPFSPSFDTGGLALAMRSDPQQVDMLTGEASPLAPAPAQRPEFELQMQDGRQGQLDLAPPDSQPQAPTAFPERNELRSNQRGFINELPFAPPEAKIRTPLGQQLYATADSLMAEGFIDDGTMTQITTMLTQNKLGAAAKLVNGALADRNQTKKALETQQQEQIAAQQQAREQAEKAAEAQRQADVERGKAVTTQPTTPTGRTADQVFEEVGALSRQRDALLQANGRAPNKGSPKRKQWDALSDQISELKAEWATLDTAERKAKKAAQPAKPTSPEPTESTSKVDKYERLVECLRA